MKPRIYRFNGIWHCGLPWRAKGIGYTPRQAYDDWLSRELQA